jgi:DNA-binding beta-propeller fold protein YncE
MSAIRNPRKVTTAAAFAFVTAFFAFGARPSNAQVPALKSAKPSATYWVYVGAESADLIHRLRFGPDGITVEKTIPAGLYPTETEGPHGLMISRDGRYLHMTTGHGLPDGMYFRYELGPDTLVGDPIPLGFFPATIDVTPDGLYAFAANFNLFGEHVPSTISVIYTPDNVEVAQIETCTMPHGSRLNPMGTMQYSVCMMDDQLVEIDTRSFKVARRFSVDTGHEGPLAMKPVAEHDMANHDTAMQHGSMKQASCSPTWAQPGVTGDRIYVACNKSDEILEIDAKSWKVLRRFPTGRAPYNLGVTPDGRLLVSSLKAAAAVEFFDLGTGRSVARTPTSTKVVHGVAISPDSKYAFVSVEGIGAEPGKVDVFDLQTFERVASAEVGQQASGIVFWRMEPASH